ncbi:MAG: ketopantoate reductase family protein, partial [Rhodomicrobium sp.]
LQVVTPGGSFDLKPRIVSPGAIQGHYDAILLAVKAYSLEGVLDDMAPAVGAETMILPMLNGMKHIDVLSVRFGKQAVLGGVCRISAHLDDQGRIVQFAKFEDLVYGELDGARTARIAELDAFMQGAAFHARLSFTIEREMWEKWVMLATLAGVTCLMRGTTGEIVAAPGGKEFINRLLDEVASVVTAEGHAPGETFLAQTRSLLTAQGSPLAASMYRDLQNGSPIEADQIIGDLLNRGRQANIAVPLLTLAYTHLAVYQSRIERNSDQKDAQDHKSS